MKKINGSGWDGEGDDYQNSVATGVFYIIITGVFGLAFYVLFSA